MAVALAVAVVVAVSALIAVLWNLSSSRRQELATVAGDGGTTSGGSTGSGTSEAGEVAASFYELGPMTHAVVSPRAPVFVTAGPEGPVTADILPRLYVWN